MTGDSGDMSTDDDLMRGEVTWDAIDRVMERMLDSSANRDYTFVRVFGRNRDSGWLIAGNNPHDSAKHHARKHFGGGEGAYFIAKYDKADPNLRTPETVRPIHGSGDAPAPVWHRQKPWESNFELPKDMWAHPVDEAEKARYPSRDEVRRDIAVRALSELSKGPDRGLGGFLAETYLKEASTRGR